MMIMKKLIYSLFILLATGVAFSCEKEKEEPEQKDTLQILNGEITFEPNGGQGTIPFEASGTVTAQVDKPWCTISVEGSQIQVSVPAYGGIETRYANVNIRCGEASADVTIHQFGVIVRSFEASDLFLKNAAAEFDFPYDANATMQVSANVAWIHPTVDGNSLKVSIDRNDGKRSRTGTVSWNIGNMADTFDITQFDPEESGLLGAWTWKSVRVNNGNELLLDANLTETASGQYELSLTSDKMNFKFTDVQTDGAILRIPLGREIGTYAANATTTYRAFCMLAPGTSATSYNNTNAVTEGYYTFDLSYDDATDKWTATARESEYANKNFRFEYWKTSAHEGSSSSRTVLKSIVLVKE